MKNSENKTHAIKRAKETSVYCKMAIDAGDYTSAKDLLKQVIDLLSYAESEQKNNKSSESFLCQGEFTHYDEDNKCSAITIGNSILAMDEYWNRDLIK